MNRQQRRSETKQSRAIASTAALDKTSVLFETAVARHRAGQFVEAETLYRQVLAIEPGHAESCHYLGVLATQFGRSDIAVAMIANAIALKGREPAFHDSLGVALNAQRRFDEAAASHRRALAINPNFAAARCNLGNVLKEQGKSREAEIAYRRALALEPGLVAAHNGLGCALKDLGHPQEAEVSFRRAIALQPDYVNAHSNLGAALTDQGKLDEAASSFRTALRLHPGNVNAHYNLGATLRLQGKSAEAATSYEQALLLNPDFPEAHSSLLMTQNYDGRVSNAELLATARRFGARFEGCAAARAFTNDRSVNRRLRIGYVSGDFRNHPVGFLLARVLETHDRGAVEVFCYANQTEVDDMTRRLQAAAGHWRDILRMSDSDAAALIQDDRIDILVDLSGHTANNRLPLFALRPAPVQVSWLGYFGTTGLGAMDYLLMDEAAVPHGEERWYTETVVRLPHGRFCYAPPDYAPLPVDPPSRRQSYVTFGSFNNMSKVGPEVVGLWAEVLRAAPTSKLILKWKSLDDQNERRRVSDAFIAAGVAAERLDLRGASPHPEMLAQYGAIDIALDPFPFGGGLTSCEALWMGVPVVTLPGDRPASRQTIGFLNLLGLGDYAARSLAEYVACATALAADPNRLTEIRRALRSRMAASSLCNGALFTPTLEAAFQDMWKQWCGQEFRNPSEASAAA
ncbi:glycosyltransferase family 41 protein [Methylocapsa sp. S129]|uniref:O-linked N-acetylglucosamine transferase, SPINDLY family protein n=1 Tax=Methylocapsa sp. S129 TaxID=1641869 RepID=UPI00131D2654|nr:glycosyltransferase family 41 protein [Methylocapsa sp. S129]